MKDQLTNEALKKHFKDNFDLAHYAIAAARYLIKSGHEVNISELLDDIQRNPKMYEVKELEAMDAADRAERAEEAKEEAGA